MRKSDILKRAGRVDKVYYFVLTKNGSIESDMEKEIARIIANHDYRNWNVVATRSGPDVQDPEKLYDELSFLLENGRNNFSIVLLDIEGDSVARLSTEEKEFFLRILRNHQYNDGENSGCIALRLLTQFDCS